MMRIGSLFSGVGGLEAGLERAGLGHTVYQVERSAFCRHILARHWPDAHRFDDVRTVGAHNLPPVDLLCGGFPCTDLSAAGKQAGFGTEDNPTRSGLWYEMRRIIGETRPTWIVGENIAQRWRAWVPVVRRSLWDLGYASVPIRVRACDVGARHERARVFVVAGPAADVDGVAVRLKSRGIYEGGGAVSAELGEVVADVDGVRSGAWSAWGTASHDEVRAAEGTAAADDARFGLAIGGDVGEDRERERAPAAGGADDASHAHRLRRYKGAPVQWGPQGRKLEPDATGGVGTEGDAGSISPGFGLPPRPWMVRGVHGLPGGLDGPWKRAGWTGARLRTARIHALGNSVVPACSEAIGRLILEATR